MTRPAQRRAHAVQLTSADGTSTFSSSSTPYCTLLCCSVFYNCRHSLSNPRRKCEFFAWEDELLAEQQEDELSRLLDSLSFIVGPVEELRGH